jgi:hypothetical protein
VHALEFDKHALRSASLQLYIADFGETAGIQMPRVFINTLVNQVKSGVFVPLLAGNLASTAANALCYINQHSLRGAIFPGDDVC